MGGEALATHTFPRLFGGVIAPAMVNELLSVIDAWHPELVIGEPGALAVPLACALRELPQVTHGFGLMMPSTHLRDAMKEFGDRWEAAGLAPPMDAGLYRHGYVDIAPPALQGIADIRPKRVWQLGPVSGDVGYLPRAARSDAGSRIYLTFGTVFNRRPALQTAVAALGGMSASVVVTIGNDGNPSLWKNLPVNVRLERYVDQAALLPWWDLVVSHAGSGTMLGAAAHGVPQLLMPQAADHFRNARALEAVGAGVALMPEACSEASVRTHAEMLIDSPTHASAARRLAVEISGMPTEFDVVDRLTRAFEPS